MSFVQDINRLESALAELPQLPDMTEHFFAKGVYARVLHIPAGSVLTGKIHRFDCINIIPKGRIHVATEDGVKLVEAPAIFTSPPGTKRAGVTLENTIWITIHEAHTQDLQILEEELIVENFEQLEQERRECLGQP